MCSRFVFLFVQNSLEYSENMLLLLVLLLVVFGIYFYLRMRSAERRVSAIEEKLLRYSFNPAAVRANGVANGVANGYTNGSLACNGFHSGDRSRGVSRTSECDGDADADARVAAGASGGGAQQQQASLSLRSRLQLDWHHLAGALGRALARLVPHASHRRPRVQRPEQRVSLLNASTPIKCLCPRPNARLLSSLSSLLYACLRHVFSTLQYMYITDTRTYNKVNTVCQSMIYVDYV